MKRGKEDEKIMGPMFPRLHVNDTEKRGPRAPPRNKMALYEQLSIPSQRFNAGVTPLNPNLTTNSVPPTSSSQGGSHEKGAFFPHQLPPSMQSAEKINSELNNQLVQQEQKKKQEEDDFRVPIFVQSGASQNHSGNHYNRDKEGSSPFSSGYSGRIAKFQNASEKEPKRTDNTQHNLGQEGISQNEENPQEYRAGIEQLAKSASNQSSRQSTKVSLRQTNASFSFGHRSNASNNSSQLQGNNGTLQLDYGVDSQPDNTIWGDSVSNEAARAVGYGNSSLPIRDVQQEVLRSPNDPTNVDAVSETSMVDSISGIDISPDDVVGIIGQKHFWKARRAIVNQQRVFAVQVFELHRLIKVQRLIAGLPNLLLEDNAYLGKSIRVSPTKKLPLEYIVKSTPNISKHKDDCEKPNDNMEFSAENAVGKASLSSVQNGSQPSNYRPFSGNPLPTADPKMGSWGFNQPPGHQWLIPVMTPSEGLVYKPYPGPGFMGPVCGGCGPPGSTPLMGHNYVNYGVPASHHHFQGPGVSHFSPPASHGYFPPYGMPLMTPSISSKGGEHMNHFNTQYRSSCDVPSEKNGAVPSTGKFHASEDSEVQVSTASSSSERTRGRNALAFFPTSPIVQLPEGVPQPCDADQPARVIRVVPHNARSATESVARIFQSIQEERKQYDSV